MAPRYSLLDDYGPDADPHRVTIDPHWTLAVIRSGEQRTYDRNENRSVSDDVALAVGPRKGQEDALVILDDCVTLTLTRQKASHTKTLQANLLPGREYQKLVRTGDWILAWMHNNRRDAERVRALVHRGTAAANGPRDGLKFLGRVEDVRRRLGVMDDHGTKGIHYSLSATGFYELDTSIFYDLNVATNDVLKQNLGKFLTRIGESVHDWLADITSKHPDRDNVNVIVPRLLDLLVGKGVAGDITPADARGAGISVALGGGAGEGAPNAYAVPKQVGRLLGRPAAGGAAVLSYADLLELVVGVQSYGEGQGWAAFVPELDEGKSTFTRRVTKTPLLGTFYISFLEMFNKPLWAVFSQYVNPAVNELFTSLRLSPDGTIMPTMTLRQIPLTSDVFADTTAAPSFTAPSTVIPHTRFTSLPRWVLPESLAFEYDLGFSDATRTNMVHVYGVSSMGANNWEIGRQMVLDPPIVDSLDIMRSGVRPYMATVDCAVDDQRDRSPGKWMRLIADWQMGLHLTLNGTVTAQGVQAPVPEGDNLEFAGCVFQIEGIADHGSLDPGSGKGTWRTTFELSHGIEVAGDRDGFPAYPLVDPALPDPLARVAPAVLAVRSEDDPGNDASGILGGAAGDFPGGGFAG